MTVSRAMHSDLERFYHENFRNAGLTNPRFILEDRKRLSWADRKPWQAFNTYEEYFHWVLNENQYSLIVQESAFVQIYYEDTNNNEFISSLSFIPEPGLRLPYLRLDCDPSAARDFIHNSFHMHIGYDSQDYRLPLHKFPFPSEFMKVAIGILQGQDSGPLIVERMHHDLDLRGEKFRTFLDFRI